MTMTRLMKRMQIWICVLCVGALLGSVVTAEAKLLSIDIDSSGCLSAAYLDYDGNGTTDRVVNASAIGRVRLVDPLNISQGWILTSSYSTPFGEMRTIPMDGGFDLDTGFYDMNAITLQFPRGCTNGPGPDIILIEIDGGDAFSATINGTTVNYTTNDFTAGLTENRNLIFHKKDADAAITSMADLKSCDLSTSGQSTTHNRGGMTIELDDYGIGAGVVVSNIAMTSSAALDPVFVGSLYPLKREPRIVSITQSGSDLESVTLDQDGNGTGDLIRHISDIGHVRLVDPFSIGTADSARLITGDEDIPPMGQRSWVLDLDARLRSGVGEIPTHTFEFYFPVTNGPGADVVLFAYAYPQECAVQINGRTTGFDTSDYTASLTGNLVAYSHTNSPGPVTSIAELESAAFAGSIYGSTDRPVLPIDLDLFGIASGESITNIQVISQNNLGLVFLGSIYGERSGPVASITTDASDNLLTVSFDLDGNGSGDMTLNEDELGDVILVDPLWLKQGTGDGVGVVIDTAVPAMDQRAALIDRDISLVTGLANVRTVTLDFAYAAENKDGPDIVIFDGGIGDSCTVAINGITNSYTATDFTPNLLSEAVTYKFYYHSAPITTVAQLESATFAFYLSADQSCAGLALELSDFRVRPGEHITQMTIDGEVTFDPCYVGVVNYYVPPPRGTLVILK